MPDSAVGFVRACAREEASVGAGNAARPSCRLAERVLSGKSFGCHSETQSRHIKIFISRKTSRSPFTPPRTVNKDEKAVLVFSLVAEDRIVQKGSQARSFNISVLFLHAADSQAFGAFGTPSG